MERMKRVILFDVINHEKHNLLDLITSNNSGIDDSIQKQINTEILCSSWKDVLQKMEPYINVFLNFKKKTILVSALSDEAQNQLYAEKYKIFLGETMERIAKKEYSCIEKIMESLLIPQQIEEFVADKEEMVWHFLQGDVEKAGCLFEKVKNTYNNTLFLLYYYLKTSNTMRNCKEEKVIHISESNHLQVEIIEQAEGYNMPYMSQSEQLQYVKFVETQLAVTGESESNFGLWCDCLFLGYVPLLCDEQVSEKYQAYKSYYQRILKCFWEVASPYIEKLIGIYYFFEDTEKLALDRELLIANMTAEDVLAGNNRKKFTLYLEYCNEKRFLGNTIWFAILPSLERGTEERKTVHHKRFMGNELQRVKKYHTKSICRELLNLLSEKKVQTFISGRGESKCQNLLLPEKEVEFWMTDINEVRSQENKLYTYPCFPNFVYIPRQHAIYKLDGEVLYLDGIAMEASYVAAKSAVTRTVMTGTAVAGEEKSPPMNFIAYEGNARMLLQKEEQAEVLREVYTMTYIERILRRETQDYKEDLIRSFFQERPGSLYEQWMSMRGSGMSPLQENEKIDYSIEGNECIIRFQFKEHVRDARVKIIGSGER